MPTNVLTCVFTAGMLLVSLCGCEYSSRISNEQVFLRQLPNLRRAFEAKHPDTLKKVCTCHGYSALIEGTDSLKNQPVIEAISKTLSSKHMVFSGRNDSTFVVMIGEGISSYDGPVGDMTVCVRNGSAKIDEYAGGVRVRE